MNPASFSSILTYIFVVLLPCFASPSPLNSLPRGSSLCVEDESTFLVSPNGSFSCGFYNVGSNAYTFSIWFSKSTAHTAAWTANRDRLVNGHGSRIMFKKDGSIVLSDVDDAVVWSTNTSSTDVQQMKLLDSGNLVVVDSSGRTLWQSFGSPTDTLLPNQPITKNIHLVSSKAKGSLFSGYYGFYFSSDNVLTLIYDGPDMSSKYWPNPDNDVFANSRTRYNSSKYGVLDEEGQFLASDRLAFNASDWGPGISRRLTLDYDGNLRLYSLNESTGSWSITWAALQRMCHVHGLCGQNGILAFTPLPQCSCPPGYKMADISDWNKGCKPKIEINCDNPHPFKYLELRNTDFWGYDINISFLSFNDCKKLCSHDCSCKVFTYKAGKCHTKMELFNGRASPSKVPNLYLKVPTLMHVSKPSVSQVYQPVCNANDGNNTLGSSIEYAINNTKLNVAYFYWFIAAFFGVEVLFITFGWWFIFRRGKMPKSLEEGYKIVSSQFRKFTYKDLVKATGKFKAEEEAQELFTRGCWMTRGS